MIWKTKDAPHWRAHTGRKLSLLRPLGMARKIFVVLQVAHLDHNPEHNDDSESR